MSGPSVLPLLFILLTASAVAQEIAPVTVETTVTPAVAPQSPSDNPITAEPAPTAAPESSPAPVPPPAKPATTPVTTSTPPVYTCGETLRPATVRSVVNMKSKLLPEKKIYSLHGKSPKNNYYRLRVDSSFYWAKVSDIQEKPQNQCAEKPMCAVVDLGAEFYKEPVEDSLKIAAQKNGSLYSVRTPDKGDGWTRVIFNNEKDYWVKTEAVKIRNISCFQVKKDVVASEGFQFRLEFGMTGSYDVNNFSNIRTQITDPNDVGSLPNPIVTELKATNGFFISPCMMKGIFFLDGLACLTVQTEKIEYSGKKNPDVGNNITLDSLANTQGSFNVTTVGIDLYLRYRYNFYKDHSFVFGAGGRSSYLVSKPSVFEVRTGTIQKQTLVNIETGPPTLKPLLLNFQLLYEVNELQMISGYRTKTLGVGVAVDRASQTQFILSFKF